jgi:hypothetical protein
VTTSLVLFIVVYAVLLLGFLYVGRVVFRGPAIREPAEHAAEAHPGVASACADSAAEWRQASPPAVVLSLAMYLTMDGFDLGVGILFPFAPGDALIFRGIAFEFRFRAKRFRHAGTGRSDALSSFWRCSASASAYGPMWWPYTVTLWQTASSEPALAFVGIGVGVTLAIILAYLGYAHWVFRGKTSARIGCGSQPFIRHSWTTRERPGWP